jgi:serine/threonine-protein kinase
MALPNKAKIPVGTILAGKYRITREIGRGGMAAVYEAENVDIGKRVAIKVLAQELTTSVIVVERFLREARAAAAIRSPFICDVYDSGKLEDGRPFLVLELLEGESLYERMTVIRHLDPETTVTVMTQVCRGLTKAHAASIVHRDLKPENIFLTKDEEGRLCAKILDFGLAKFYAPLDGGDKQARLTREGAVFGTPAYMSPEQVRGQGAVDHRADLWALGCITYECLTGRTVWQTDQGVAMTFAQIANAPLPRPLTFRPDLPLGFGAWFERALDRTIDNRFQTAKEFADELSLALNIAQPLRGMEPSQAVLPARSEADIPVELGNGETPMDPDALLELPRRYSPEAATARPEPPRLSPPMPKIPTPTPTGAAALSLPVPAGGAEPASRASPASTSNLAFAGPEGASKGGAERAGRGSPAPSIPQGQQRGGAGRALLTLVVLGVLGAGAYAGYHKFLKPPGPKIVTTSIPSASSAPQPPDSGAIRSAPPPSAELPWTGLVAEAQEAIATGDLKAAFKLLKDAYDKGGHGVPRTFLEHIQIAMKEASGKAPCQLTGLARPRTYDLTAKNPRAVTASRPSLVMGPRGVVITWSDAHEGSEHAYTAALDSAMRPTAAPINVTPEGTAVGRPELTLVGDRLVLTYWDASGPEAGVHVRWLDADGRIAGPSVAVSTAPRRGNVWPTLARTEDGFFVVWSDEREPSSEDLFLRRLSANLDPAGEIVRLTDVVPSGSAKPRARYPSLATQGDALHIAFRLEREPQHLIQHMRLPIADAAKELEPKASGPPRNRMLGEVSLVNTDKARSDGPGIACGGGACYLVWHGNAPTGGASAAYIDPAKAQPLWRKKFAKAGMDPAIAMTATGQAQLFWYEGGRVATASINRDGVGAPTKFARISGDQPMPSVAPGSKPGEWYVAWLDYEAGHLEPYAARILCR